jgi:isopentenyldiphosphate isomerase
LRFRHERLEPCNALLEWELCIPFAVLLADKTDKDGNEVRAAEPGDDEDMEEEEDGSADATDSDERDEDDDMNDV